MQNILRAIALVAGLVATNVTAETFNVSIGVNQAGQRAFMPDTVTVKPGDTVEWKNNHTQSHTVTPDNAGAFPASGNMPPNSVHRITIGAQQAPGRLGYSCDYHGEMTGTVVVVAP